MGRACEVLLIVKRPVKVLRVIVMLPEFNFLLVSVTGYEV